MSRSFRASALAGGVVIALLLFSATPGFAVPTLQVDIFGGTYDPTTETTVTSDKTFTVRAWLTPGNDPDLISEWYYLSVAVAPKVADTFNPTGSSFEIDGDTINVTEEMSFGVPPLEAAVEHDAQDLGKHSIFETFFAEFEFKFDPLSQYATVNVQDDPGTALASGTGSYVIEFEIDATNLSGSVDGQPIGLHFDLYSSKVKDGDTDVDDFAPFSHDAEYRPPTGGGGGSGEIPEPASVAIWTLLGVIGLAVGANKARAKSGRVS
jgi:hypothetical protein